MAAHIAKSIPFNILNFSKLQQKFQKRVSIKSPTDTKTRNNLVAL